MARPERFERPTSGSGEHRIILTRYENCGLYYIRQRVTTTVLLFRHEQIIFTAEMWVPRANLSYNSYNTEE